MKKIDDLITEAYQISTNEALKKLDSNLSGIGKEESQKRLIEYGPNSLNSLRKSPIIFKFLAQFKDLMILLLIVCAGISLYLDDIRTAGILIAIVIINAMIGFIQEFKADKVMDSLKSLMVPEAKVYCNGQLETIEASRLVPGDIIYVEEGDSIPADGRILEENEVSTNDFALTGESNPCRKFTHAIKSVVNIGDRRNLIFMGTTVATGDAICLVTATGMNTELGRIASLSQSTKSGTSTLQKEMNNLAYRITIATLILATMLIFISLGAHLSLADAFLFAISISSAMIPQGLPAEVSVSLSRAASILAKDRALVKKLSAVETLGATSIICTDKTGTLTKNEMTVEQVALFNKTFSVSGSGYDPHGEIQENGKTLGKHELNNLQKFILTGYFASNAKIYSPDDSHPVWYCIGDPTEAALITLTRKSRIDIDMIDKQSPELKEFPFDSVRKRMSSVRVYEGDLTVFVKGAPESILDKCTRIWLPDGTIRKINKDDKKIINSQNDEMANNAMRNLAYAYKNIDKSVDYKQHDPDVVENDLIYMGMVSIIDPIREEVAGAMQAARDANIKVSIITGDYALTAKAIAIRAKLADDPGDIEVVEGSKLQSLGDSEVLNLVVRGSIVFSRVSPEDKMRIVGLVKDSGLVIAVTGDGINDAPALKRADIGVAMGKTGTDVAKQSAEIILLDDSFHTLVGAIQRGRTVYQNIKKATVSCLTSNFGELITVLVGLVALSLAGIPPAITPILILSIDLIAELFPIAALGWDEPDGELMRDQPRNPKDHIFNTSTFFDLLYTGILIGVLAFGNYLLFAYRNSITASSLTNSNLYFSAVTITYVTIVLCQLVNILVRRSRGATLSSYLFTNKQLWMAMGLSVICVLGIVYIPVINQVFGSGPLSLIDWFFAILAALIFFMFKEIGKTINRRNRLS
ncbi:MAG: P-type Ca2+ transporter type [Patescibacteria group bacterium]|nr:P-type Ca2+ transporter type [Patescibacteria group bacterium]